MSGRSLSPARPRRSLLSATTPHRLRLSRGGLFSAGTQAAPSVTSMIGVLLPPESRHMLSGSYFCSLTLLSSHLGTVARTHVPSTSSPTYAQSQTASPAAPTGIDTQRGTPGPGQDWGCCTDATLTHLSAVSDATRTDKVPCAHTHVTYS